MWIVMIQTKGGYKMHSTHGNESTAKLWAECKEHDGEQTAILALTKNDVAEIRDTLDKLGM